MFKMLVDEGLAKYLYENNLEIVHLEIKNPFTGFYKGERIFIRKREAQDGGGG